MLSLKGRDFLTMMELQPEELLNLIDFSIQIKEMSKKGLSNHNLLNGKTIALIFQKPSTRTRVSFEVAINQLGGKAIYLSWNELQLSRGESIMDTAKVLSRYVDAIVARVYSHQDLVEMAQHSDKPVINALSDMHHPCQALADLMTIKEHFGKIKGLKLAFVGDGNNNVTHSLLIAATMTGMDIAVASPKNYEPNPEIINKAKGYASISGSKILITNDPLEAVSGSDIVYTDVFVSMGKESEREQRLKIFKDFQVNDKLFNKANDKAVFMHCGPWHVGEEVTASVVYGPKSIVYDQAENRLHTEKALLSLLL